MATRFYFDRGSAGGALVTVDPSWGRTLDFIQNLRLLPKNLTPVITTLSNGVAATIPITTTESIVCQQFVSPPLPAQIFTGTVSAVIAVFQSVTTANATLAMSVRLVSQDGGTIRGTLFSIFGTDTAYATTQSTRIVNAQSITPMTLQQGDRIVVEVGVQATAPSTSGTFNSRFGFIAQADFALTSALTTDLNPWIEFSQDIYAGNYLRKVNRGLRPHPFSPGLAR